MARKKVTPEEEIVNTAVEGTALGSVPAGSVLHDEAGADTGDVPAELPEGDLSAEETAEQSETLPAMEAAEAKPFGLSAAEKTASQEENDTVEKRAEEAELHEETSEFLEAAEDLHSNLPASAPHGSEADGADWGFEEPVTEEAAAEPAEDEYLAADNAETLDASDEKSERTLFYELDFNELDRGLSEEERKEWNSIYASFRGRSAITGTIIGVDLYARYLPRSEARMLENKRELCAVVVPYRIPILTRESEMWELGEERPDFVLRNMVGASIDVIVTTNRRPLPNMEPLKPFNVIYQTAEDGLGDTVKPRLLEAGADLDRVMVIDDGDKPLTLSDKRIERAIRENHARLLIIDPVQAFLGADVDMNRANEVRPIFRRLGEISQETGCAIILIGHLNKAAGSQSTYRGLGSIDITAVVRSLLFIGKVKNDPTTRVLIQEKSSLAPPGKSLAFSLGDGNGFQWIGEYDMTADELLAGVEHTETKAEQAEKLILDLLADGKQMLSADIDKAAAQRGISARTVRTAKQSLGNKLISERSSTQWLLSLKA